MKYYYIGMEIVRQAANRVKSDRLRALDGFHVVNMYICVLSQLNARFHNHLMDAHVFISMCLGLCDGHYDVAAAAIFSRSNIQCAVRADLMRFKRRGLSVMRVEKMQI